MNDRAKRDMAESGFLTAEQAAAFLAVSTKRVYQLRQAGVLTYGKNGGRLVFPRKALVEYAAQHIKLGRIA